MVGEPGTHRRLLIVLIITLVLVQVAIAGYLVHLLRPPTPQETVVEPRLARPRGMREGTSAGSRPTAGPVVEGDDEVGAQIGSVRVEVASVARSPVPATDVAGLAGGFDEEQALEHIAYLASDERNGRQPGTPGGRAAADYIAERFAAYGLEPAGIHGTYYQTFTVPYGRITTLPVLNVTLPDGQSVSGTYDYRTDYRALTGGYLGAGQGEGPVVWLNACLHGDYDGLDMVGKIVLCRYTGDPSVYREAIEHQVGGLLLLDRDRGREPFRRGGYRETAWVPETIPAYLISDVVARDLLKGTDYTLDGLSLRFSTTPLSTTARMAVTTEEQDQVVARNVLGLLPGSDPEYGHELVVVGAHYDHLGPEPDGTIMNGANDNGSGVATLLEIARLWQVESLRPARSVLFAAWDGEEQGLLGSRHYVEHPVQPITQTVSMLNLDMVGAGETLQIDGEGSVAMQLELGAEAYGLTYTSTFHGRSDHMPFYSTGVPAAMLIWWPDDFYHTEHDELGVIEPGKLKAVGVLSTHTLAALAEGQVEVERAVASIQASVASRDRDAFVALLDPTDPELEAIQTSWFDRVWSRGLADILIEPRQIRLGDGEAWVTLKLAFHWADEERRRPSVTYPARLTRRDGTWRLAGPHMDESVGDVVSVARLAGTSVDTRELVSTTQQAYLSLAADLGVEPIVGTRFVIYPDEQTLRATVHPGARDESAWLVPAAGLAHIARGEPITPALVSLVLNQMGLPSDQGQWLRDGLVAYYEDDASSHLPTLVATSPPSPLLAPDGSAFRREETVPATWEEQAPGARAVAWSLVDYLLERYGTVGLPALCAAWRRDGPEVAFEDALGLSAEQFESAWLAARIRPLRAAAAEIHTTIEDRTTAVLEGDVAKFLSTVTLSDPVLRAEECQWFVDLTDYPTQTEVLSYTVGAELVDWMPRAGEARVVLQTGIILSDGRSSHARHLARFVPEVGRWRYAGLVWNEFASDHFLLKVQHRDSTWAGRVLAQAEEAYDRVARDLGAPPSPQQIKIYEDEADFQASTSPLLARNADSWTAGGQAIKLWLDQGTGRVPEGAERPFVLDAIARGLTYQVLAAQGVETAWVREGVAAFEWDRLRPLGIHWGSGTRQRMVRDALGSRQALHWDALTSFDDLSEDDLELARAQSWSLIATLVADHGLDGLQRFVAEAARSNDLASNLRNGLGVDPEAFLVRWRDDAQNLRGTHGAPDDLLTLARQFDSGRAMGHVVALSSPEFEGRQAGSPGAAAAATYIAEQFSAARLEPLGDLLTASGASPAAPQGAGTSPVVTSTLTATHSAFQRFPISYTHVLTVPSLALLDAAGDEYHRFAYGRDFVEVAGRGVAEGQAVWVSSVDLEGLHFDGALVIEEDVRDPAHRAAQLEERGAGGLIILTDRDPGTLRDFRGRWSGDWAVDTIPVFELAWGAFEPLLERFQIAAEDLTSAPAAIPLDARVRMALPRSPLTTTTTANVLALLPGSDADLAREVLVVGAHYDHLGRLPDGAYFPGANQNASGVAAMLEMAHVWQRAGYRPARSVLLAAWGGEERDSAGVGHYLGHPVVPLTRTVAAISLDSIADGAGYRLWFHGDADKDLPLTHRLEVSAAQLDREAWRKGAVDQGWQELFARRAIPAVELTWAESEDLAYRLTDTADALDPERLANSGEILTLAVSWLAAQ
jgi:Zn-dependent M28 family amino/carboxypeptidase